MQTQSMRTQSLHTQSLHTQTLGHEAVQKDRLARLDDPHIAPLTAFARRLQATSGLWTPHFDPESGGTDAQVLLLLESPGPKVSQTQFVSADNPDQTAENMSCLLKLAGLSRRRVLLWNIVPWQLSAERVVTPTRQHLLDAVPATLELLTLLPRLRVVVLVGARAEAGWLLAQVPPIPDVTILTCPHPSPLNFGPRPAAAALAVSVLGQARQLCS